VHHVLLSILGIFVAAMSLEFYEDLKALLSVFNIQVKFGTVPDIGYIP
jgi:hypothetical protein